MKCIKWMKYIDIVKNIPANKEHSQNFGSLVSISRVFNVLKYGDVILPST